MKTTAAVLKSLQDYYASLPTRPSIKEVAHTAGMPVATTGRYLNGTTQQGDIERVRALCIALDRHDLLEDLPKGAPAINSFQDAWALVVEIKRESRESNLEELERVRQSHEASEKRLLAELERTTASKDKTIDVLLHRVSLLEKDKADLAADKATMNAELEHARKGKRKYEKFVFALLILLLAYFVIFDLPYPDSGITEFVLNLFH